ncbi:VOC family protein [Rodentibacter genomosp. 2]|uniref:Metalloprotein n=1 Tax=Rodentibacter genomosp. 2 TaxID=1908266 RepID=A0A1V3JJQ6_9PAST|nr:VOC family protein [Rodentibacter genomosp. 2]OOF56647.1 metalloprotein [Rodentibacter genomosp. 2]
MKLNENLLMLEKELEDFERKIQELANMMVINLSDYEIDHIALRANSEQKAKNWLTHLVKCGRILSDNIINGRSIYLIQLEKPLAFAGQFVDVIELPFPKNKQYSQETWEHIEIVVPFLADEQTEAWIERINKQFLWQRLSKLTTKVSEPKAEGERLANPSIAVSFVDKSENYTCIKVHPYSIKKILEV